MQDQLIIIQLKEGDEEAFNYVFTHYYNLLCRFAFHLLHDKETAEEIVDDVIFYLWEHREEVTVPKSLKAYLLTAVRNRCLNELTSLAHRIQLQSSSVPLDDSLNFLNAVFTEENHPLGYLLEEELEDKLRRSVDSLPKECHTVFAKSRFEEKSYEEIASELGISVNTVKYHIKKALSILRKDLSDYLSLLLFIL